MNKKITLILADQLFETHPALDTDTDFVMVESKALCNRLKYHKFKPAYFLTCMREYRDYLKSLGKNVYYFKLDQGYEFLDALKEILTKNNYQEIQYTKISDKPVRKMIYEIALELGLKVDILDTPSFLTTYEDFKDYLNQSNHKYLMNSFYIWQRKRLGIFVDQNQKPKFGKWSFDAENRKKLPKNIEIPEIKSSFGSENYKNVAALISQKYADNPGYLNLNQSWLPINHFQARNTLKDFLERRMELFGDFEDAMTNTDDFVFHSVLSPMINNGLLTPQTIIEEVLKYSEKIENIESIFNSIEGFIRQVIGWREWIKLVYEFRYDYTFRDLNYFDSNKKLPDYFYNLEDDINNYPLEYVLQKVSRLGWAHHIERLMILSNWMTLNSYNPNDCYDWFLSQFVDAYEWVMVPNVYGMGLFADGGIFATKPYISGGNYIKKMSDFKDDGWSQIWTDKFWGFLELHREYFEKQPRLGMLLKSRDKKIKK